jgi:hypothetical protein
MSRQEPGVHAIELGDGLRRVMHRAGINSVTVAERLGLSTSVVSRMLTGHRKSREGEVEAFLDMCGVASADERGHLVGLVKADQVGEDAASMGWLPGRRRRYVAYERAVSTLTTYQDVLVPDLLRTDDYIWAVVSADANIPAGEVEAWFVAGQAQRVVLTRPNPPTLTVLLHEPVLRLPVGGPRVMAEQLRHLLQMAWRPNISIRVIPTSFGAPSSPVGSFALLEFPRLEPVVYVHTALDGVFLDHPEEVANYRGILRATADAALSEEESTQLIVAAAEDISTVDALGAPPAPAGPTGAPTPVGPAGSSPHLPSSQR